MTASPVFDIAVIGGGLHGLSVALHLARQGLRIIVLERDWCGRHASGASSAGIRTLGRDAADLPLALKSLDMWHNIAELVGDDCGFRAHGNVRAAENEADLSLMAARVADLNARGYHHERMIGREELRELVPSLSPHLVGAAYAPRDGMADPHRTLMAFRRAAIAAGVDVRERCGVHTLRQAAGDWQIATTKGEELSAGGVVNAAGAWGARIARLAGETIPLSVEAPMEMVTEPVSEFVRPVVGIVGRKFGFKQAERGGLMIGGGLQGPFDMETGRVAVDFRALAASARSVQEILPGASTLRILRCWGAVEALTKDQLPVISRSSVAENLWHVFGFSGRGFQLIPAVGAEVATLVMSGHKTPLIAAFSHERLTEH